MAQFFTAFDDSPTLAELWNTGAGVVTIETSGLPSGAGTHAMKVQKTGSGRYLAYWSNPGSVSGDVEMLIRWQSNNIGNTVVGIYIHASGSAGSENAYAAIGGSSGAQMVRWRFLSGSASSISPHQSTISPVITTNTWVWTRIQYTGTTFRQRTWVDGNSEPGGWDATGTDTNLSSGYVGIGSNNASVAMWVSQIGVGTGGDPAPDAPVSADIPANLIRTQHYGPRALTGGPRGIW